MFPVIKQLADLLPYVRDNEFIRVKKEPNGMTVVCYMLQDDETFEGPNAAYERECRGITFYEDARIASRPFHKFFNIGEREETQPQNLQWSQVARIMDKRDGSMVVPVLLPHGNYFKFKTKKSFSTSEAALADKLCFENPVYHHWVLWILQSGCTPIFEVTSPRFPIVLRYPKDELTLLAIRDNQTGRYVTELGEGAHWTKDCPFPIVKNVMEEFYGDGVPTRLVSWEKLKAAAETREGIEGWVIQFNSGEMVKLKTKWYCDLHHAVTFTRWRDIARAVCDDKADDLKGAFALTGRSIEPILQVERKIKSRLDAVKLMVEVPVKAGLADGASAKDMALKWKDDEHFGLIMTLFRGKEPDYLAWYVKNHLEKDFGLEVVEFT